jgi:hypothetical protein
MKNLSYDYVISKEYSPIIQILSFSLSIRQFLGVSNKIKLTIPDSIYSEIPLPVFEELIFDNLSQLTSKSNLISAIMIKPTNYFRIDIILSGD